MSAAGFDLDTLREEVREHCGFLKDDTSSLPDATVDRFINRSFWSHINSYPFKVVEQVDTFETVAGTRKYETPVDFEAIRVISIVSPDTLNTGKHRTLNRKTQTWYEDNYNEADSSESVPTDYIREANCIKLFPTPDDIYTIVISYLASLDDLSDSNPDLIIPRVWSEIIVLGATWRYYLKHKDYLNFENMQAAEAVLIGKIVSEQAKDETDSKLAGLDVAGYADPNDLYDSRASL